MIQESYSAQDTFAFGKKLGETAVPGDVFCLSGDLGTGKTVLTKGFAFGLGIEEPVSSPTFTILQIYEEGRLALYHFDVYRMSGSDELLGIGGDEYFDKGGVCLIEWAELIEDIIPKRSKRILIEKDLTKGLDYRRITVTE